MEPKIIPLLKVTGSSSDGSVKIGDCVWYSENGNLNFAGGGSGCIEKADLTPETTNVEYVEHPLYVVVVTNRSEKVVAKSALLSAA